MHCNLKTKLLAENKSLQEELKRTRENLKETRAKQKKAGKRERDWSRKVKQRDATISQLRQELKNIQTSQHPRDEENMSEVISKSEKKRKIESANDEKDEKRENQRVENPRDPRRQKAKARRLEDFRLNTNESFFQSGLPWVAGPPGPSGNQPQGHCFDQRPSIIQQTSRQSFSSFPFNQNPGSHYYQSYQFYRNQALVTGNMRLHYNLNNTSQ